MNETNNQTDKLQTKVEVLHEEGKINVTITCNGSKLTKADSGRFSEISEEIWTSVKSTKADAGKIPDIDISIHERYGAKTTKADAGKTV